MSISDLQNISYSITYISIFKEFWNNQASARKWTKKLSEWNTASYLCLPCKFSSYAGTKPSWQIAAYLSIQSIIQRIQMTTKAYPSMQSPAKIRSKDLPDKLETFSRFETADTIFLWGCSWTKLRLCTII